MPDDTQDGELDRPRVYAPETSALEHDAAPASSGAALHVRVVTDIDDTQAPHPVTCSRTRTFETSDAEIEHALRTQCTPQVLNELHRYAYQQARIMSQYARSCPPPRQYARELVHDAYADTLCGDRTWDPRRVSAFDHLRGVIDSRISHEIRAARRYTSLDAPPVANDNDPHSNNVAPALVDRLAGASSGDASSLLLAGHMVLTCQELRQATNDRDCLKVLRAWERGFVERDEVIELTELDPAAYGRARKRLLYLANDLPDELRQLVRDYLRSAS